LVDGVDPGSGAALLDAQERARADRFRFARDRERFIARRVFYRRVLTGYLGAGTPLVIHATPQGRPYLDPATELDFNTSHSHGLAVIAVSRGSRVGVDVERLRPLEDSLVVAAGLTSQRELAQLHGLPSAARAEAFLTLWTRTEALVKASGDGLAYPLADLDTSGRDADGVVRVAGLADGAALTWSRLDVATGFVATVAVIGDQLAIRHMALAELAV
jgi:4'-phosphopantetheinyl transferase